MKNPLTIGIWVNHFPLLSESFISLKVLKLLERGYMVQVFCGSKNQPLLYGLFGAHPGLAIIVLDKKGGLLYAMQYPIKFISNKRRAYQHYIASAINKNNPDILHVEFSGLACANPDALKIIKSKLVVSCRGTAEKVKLISDDKRGQQLKEVFKVVSKVHCVSEDMQRTISPYCSEPNKIFINRPAVDTTYFQPHQVAEAGKDILVLSVGRLTFQKGFFIGLLAMKKVVSTYPSIQWLIAGDGPDKEELLFHIQQLQLQGYVSLAGSKSKVELKKLYDTADIFFLPSIYEGIANAALEAMSMQLPVVSAKAGGMEEVITHGVNGLLADVYDHEKLAENILLLVQNAELRWQLGTAARKHVVENFHIDRQIKIFEEVYRELVEEKMH